MMLSRIADSLFWLNRYMERIDAVSRSMRVFYITYLDASNNLPQGYYPLLRTFTNIPTDKAESIKNQTTDVLPYLIADTSNYSSVRLLLSKARENARGSQDKITKEVWEQINAMYHFINDDTLVEKLKGPEVLDVLDKLDEHCLLYNGIVDSTMPRGLGWEFMNVGKFIERTASTATLADAYCQYVDYNPGSADNLVYWRSLLLSLSGYELYLKSNRGQQHGVQSVEQVLFDQDFPRSLLYSLTRLEKYVAELLQHTSHADARHIEKHFGRLRSMVEFADSRQLYGETLRKLLFEVNRHVWDFSLSFSRMYFSYT